MTSSESAGSDGGLLAAAWRPAAGLYLAVMLLALAVGLYPQAVAPSAYVPRGAPRVAVQTLAVAQLAFAFLFCPLVILRRTQAAGSRRYAREALIESIAMFVAAVPLYAIAAYLSDATVADVVRAWILVACAWTLPWAAGAPLAAGRRGAWAILLALWLAFAGLPAAHYLAREFFAVAGDPAWLWRLGPATFAWTTAASRQGLWLPQPAWAALIWPLAAAGLWMIHLLLGPRKEAPRPQGTER